MLSSQLGASRNMDFSVVFPQPGCACVRGVHAYATVAGNGPHPGCLLAEAIQINVIIPELSLIRVINVQRQQEVPSLLAAASSASWTMAVRQRKVCHRPHLSGDSPLHVILFQRAAMVVAATTAAKTILHSAAASLCNPDKCLCLGPPMRNQ